MPNYRFFSSPTDNKLEEIVRGVNPEFRLLQLHSLFINPVDQINSISLVIMVQGTKDAHSFSLINLYPHPIEKSILYFNANGDYRTIALPSGYKDVIFKIQTLPSNNEFEIRLSCEFMISLSKI